MDNIQAFDTLFTTNHLQMLKLLLPCLPPEARRSLAIFIKAAELRYTMEFLRSHPFAMLLNPCGNDQPADLDRLFQSLLPFCTPAEKGKLQNMQNLFRNMGNIQEMMQTLDALREIMPEFASDDLWQSFSGENGGMDLNRILELIKGMAGDDPASN